MTYKQWEKMLLRRLKLLSKEERDGIAAYYREIWGDKIEAGFSEYEILLEFGSPEQAAARILSEDREGGEKVISALQKKPEHSTAVLVCKIVLGILLLLPLGIAMVSIIISFGAVAVSGVGVAFGGIVLLVWSLFQLSVVSYGLALLGTSLAMIGVGLMLFAVFWYATKYCAIGMAQTLKAFFAWR